nr:M1 family aminopeptidase [uncultured Sphingomonas sp.]
MFLGVAGFEIRYHLRNPVFWVALGIFFLFGFGLTASENVQLGTPGAVHENAPYAIAIAMALFTMFYQFVVTSFVANAIVRDDSSGFGPIIRSTRLTKYQLVLGRFTGGFIISVLGYISVPLGMAVGVMMPWVDPQTVGPGGIMAYAWNFLIIAIPNIFLVCAFLFGLATIFRSMMGTYIGLIVYLIAYTTGVVMMSQRLELVDLFAKFEPIGMAAIQESTRYWTTTELNSRLLPLAGNVLFNRLFVLGLGIVMLALTSWKFSMTERAPSKRKLKKLAKADARQAALASVAPARPDSRPQPAFGAATTRDQFMIRLKTEVMQVLKSPGLMIIMLLAVVNTSADILTARTMYDVGSYPLTADVITSLQNGFPLFMLMIAIFYGGELVWRERDRKLNEILDSSPVSDWVMVIPKVLAILLVLMLAALSGALAGIAIQAFKGNGSLEIGHYFSWFVLPITLDMMLIAILSVFFQVLSPNKYVGWALMMVWFVAGIFLNNLGYTNILYIYAGTPSAPLSDMNGSGGYWVGPMVARLYWLSFGVLLMLFAHLVWPRGTVTAVRPRLAEIGKRLTAPVAATGIAALLVMIGSGAVIYRNIKQLNVYRTSDEVEKRTADYERKYLKYVKLDQPVVTAVSMNVDIHPSQKRLDTAGVYDLRNETGKPIPELHVQAGNDSVTFDPIAVKGATLVSADKDMGYYIYRFDTPLAPGAATKLTFASHIWHRGFANGVPQTDVALNGTFVNNFAITPQIGMTRDGLLSDPVKRRRQGLPAELRMAKLEDMSATRRNDIGAGYVMSKIRVTTDADQTPVAPGERVSDTTANGRRTALFVSKSPIQLFFSIQSARYAVDRRMHNGVMTEVYYHPAHKWNVPVMQKALATGLDYYQSAFGPYQFNHARIIEFPGYQSFAQAFAGTMPYSESIGFAANLSDPQKIDMVTYVTAHELGHQYWGHQVAGAQMQGSTFTVESLAQYSALMVMKKIYGPDKIRLFLKEELDRYLRRRKGELIEELPLARVENQQHIHYQKGSLAMYLLQERLGEDAVNRALARYVQKWKFGAAPYPRSLDVISEFRKEAKTPEQQALITDLFEKITIYDLKVTDAVTRKDRSGNWVTTLTVDAGKYYAAGDGTETRTPLNEQIEIGLFTERPGSGTFDRRNVIEMKRMPIHAGKQTIVLTTKARPSVAGIDPYNFYIDRNSDDNLSSVTG